MREKDRQTDRLTDLPYGSRVSWVLEEFLVLSSQIQVYFLWPGTSSHPLPGTHHLPIQRSPSRRLCSPGSRKGSTQKRTRECWTVERGATRKRIIIIIILVIYIAHISTMHGAHMQGTPTITPALLGSRFRRSQHSRNSFLSVPI